MIRAVLMAVMLFVGLARPGFAMDKPTQDGVKDLTLKAAAVVEASGLDPARDRFHQDGDFKYGEIYVNVIDYNGTWLIYPPNPKNEGKSVLNVKDAEGKLLVQDIIKTARESGEGWVEYHWLNPATNKIQPKLTFVKNVASRNVIVYVGLYK
ncbi:chemotaxis protein [Paramagnetospirillum kuznetsovii]|uniref:Chemotaxis protein n=1 Tax=Paramagnetospirillum kuznetsovii TaxID=2053833 RepID=A0A364P014_9PROT|nr:cache domain-containing protein [Paramagnetospirillum kuznetsovii]RAU22682.1 chemotaxis protein [Paramagnetospirillum kuznetsovii]